MNDLLYKVVSRSEWQKAESAGEFAGAAIDLSDGFIHLSAADQVVETVRLHFAGQDDLLLVAVDPEKLGDSLRWESSRGGAIFPHLYGKLPLSAVKQVDELPLVERAHQFPNSFVQ